MGNTNILNKPTISVIVSSYNSENTIVSCLEAIVNQNIGEPFEIIVVDSSVDSTPKLIREKFPQVKLIHREKRTDYGVTRNIGIKAARGDIICFIDADCIASRDWLQKMYDAHRRFPKYAGVGGPFINGTPWYSLTSWAAYIAQQTPFLPRGKPRDVTFILGGNSSYKREVFKKYGGFTPQYGFDYVYGHRLIKHGEKLLFDPNIQVIHIHKSSLYKFLIHQLIAGESAARGHLKINPIISYFSKLYCMAPFIALIMGCTKAIVNIIRLLRWRRITMLTLLPIVFPVYILGLIYWMIGFANVIYRSCR